MGGIEGGGYAASDRLDLNKTRELVSLLDDGSSTYKLPNAFKQFKMRGAGNEN